MALTRSAMQLIAVGGAAKIYSYSTADAKATIVAADYFLPMYADLNPGDVVHVRSAVGGTEVHFDLSILASTNVTVTCFSGAARA